MLAWLLERASGFAARSRLLFLLGEGACIRFTLPLHLFRAFLLNFPFAWRVPAVLAIYLIGTMRVYGSASEGYGRGAVLACRAAFDPTMGINKMSAML